MPHPRLASLLATLPLLLGLPACEGGDGTAADAAADAASDAPDASPPGAVATASGHAFDFSPQGGRLEGATVTVRELPDRSAVTGPDGAWSLPDLPVGAPLTFEMTADGRPPIHTATLVLPPEGLERVSFQAPDDFMFELMAGFVEVTPDPGRCQLAATVTRVGHSLYDGSGTHGEPGATVTLDPPLPPEHGPIYFNLLAAQRIYPDRGLAETTDDGGVLWVNVPPGTYVLRAHKPGAVFREVTLPCRPGWVANASPPWGLQALEGGIGP